MENIKCKICDKEFEPKSTNARYCSDECRKVAAFNNMKKGAAKTKSIKKTSKPKPETDRPMLEPKTEADIRPMMERDYVPETETFEQVSEPKTEAAGQPETDKKVIAGIQIIDNDTAKDTKTEAKRSITDVVSEIMNNETLAPAIFGILEALTAKIQNTNNEVVDPNIMTAEDGSKFSRI